VLLRISTSAPSSASSFETQAITNYMYTEMKSTTTWGMCKNRYRLWARINETQLATSESSKAKGERQRK